LRHCAEICGTVSVTVCAAVCGTFYLVCVTVLICGTVCVTFYAVETIALSAAARIWCRK
jgi:hypothetical protein